MKKKVKKVSKAYKAFIELPDGSFTSFEHIYNDLMSKLQEVAQEHLDRLFLIEEKEIDEEE